VTDEPQVDAQDDDEFEELDPTRVIFTLSVMSDDPIPALLGMPGRTRAPRPDDGELYTIHHFDVTDDDWMTRGDAVDAALNEAFDKLDATGLSPEELSAPGVWVRALFTFNPGSETIHARVVQRMAKYHTTIWIDSLN
jgi:hypothetical protein